MPSNNHNNNNNLNPFNPQQPAQPEFFANRKTELDAFREMAINSARLGIPSPVNFAILGTWGQGKTSLLWKFRRMLTDDLREEMKCACIYYPLNPISAKSWDVFTAEFLHNLRSNTTSTNRISQKIRKELAKWEPSFSLGVVGVSRKAGEETLSMLDSLQTLWEKHLAPTGTQIAFVLLDDFHYFPLKKEESAYLTLRTTFQELVNRKCNYALVVTAPALLYPEIAELAEPVVRFFEPMRLKSLTVAEAKEVIEVRLKSVRSRITVRDDAIESIAQKTGGHPYFLVYLMRELLRALKQERVITKELFEEAWPSIERSLGEMIFSQKFHSATQAERRLLIEIAKSQSERVSPIDFKHIKGAPQLLSRLEKKELLIRQERGKYSLFHPLFSEYLRRQ
ncbi:MAG: P-loop NTPase fold protein [Nitrososphaerales archaeon]|jgi:hypothetical protein